MSLGGGESEVVVGGSLPPQTTRSGSFDVAVDTSNIARVIPVMEFSGVVELINEKPFKVRISEGYTDNPAYGVLEAAKKENKKVEMKLVPCRIIYEVAPNK